MLLLLPFLNNQNDKQKMYTISILCINFNQTPKYMTKFLDEYFFPPEFHFQSREKKKKERKGKERREGKKATSKLPE